jgi:ABC-2 type transport system permease protein
MLLAVLKKEILLTLRDIHALAVLFAMPVAFILVMSFALQETDQDRQKTFDVGLIFKADVDKRQPEVKQLKGLTDFQFHEYPDRDSFGAVADQQQLIAGVVIPADFFQRLRSEEQTDSKPIEIYYQSTTPTVLRKLLLASLRQVIAAIQLERRLAKEVDDPFLRRGMRDQYLAKHLFIEKENTTTESDEQAKPSSVQQSVPAWLIFSMFFVVIPIATTIITEKQNGTHQRLMTLPVTDTYLLLGKLIPYLIINLIQTVLMFLVGIYLVPLLGGEGLVLLENAWLLIPMSLSVGISAISLALLIATFVQSTEQATTIGGVINLLLAAIGGIMVPIYVMPDVMQQIAVYSPMNWGLEGFLAILLREGQLSDILPYMRKLLILAAVFFILTLLNYRRVVASH